MPRVSVILISYNGASRGFLRSAVESVLAQTYDDFELLLVDDGSTDSTAEKCRSFTADSRVRYIWKENGGIGSARNKGIAESKGDLICFLDDDDEWLPEKLARQVELYDSAPSGVGLVYTGIEVVDAKGQTISIQVHQPEGNFYRGLFYKNAVDSPSSVMIPRTVLARVGSFRVEIRSEGGVEDREMWIRIARHYTAVTVGEPLVRYRIHASNMSGSHENMENAELKMLERAIDSASDEIKAERNDIIGTALRRFAHNRFTIGDYSVFRKYFHESVQYGPRGTSLWIRFIVSFFPVVVNPMRRILGRAERQS